MNQELMVSPQPVRIQRAIRSLNLEEALAERDRLLAEKPHLKKFQEEIDRCLNQAGNHENRMAVLEIMIGAHVAELQKQLQGLSELLGTIFPDRRPRCLSQIKSLPRP